jgi:hypothetical protein
MTVNGLIGVLLTTASDSRNDDSWKRGGRDAEPTVEDMALTAWTSVVITPPSPQRCHVISADDVEASLREWRRARQ